VDTVAADTGNGNSTVAAAAPAAPLNLAEAKIIMQVGTPRTGSTFQWYLLCTAANMKLHDLGEGSVHCAFAPNASNAEQAIREHGHKLVLKMHQPPPASCKSGGCFVFTSHTNDRPKWPGTLYQQVSTRLLVAPLAEVSRYEAAFDLSAADVTALQGYFRYWSVLRECCGSQMSLEYRLRLHGCANDTILAKDPDSLHYPACEAYDIREVAELMGRTSIVTRGIHSIFSNKFGGSRSPTAIVQSCEASRQAIIDGMDFNGDYFTSCKQLVAKWGKRSSTAWTLTGPTSPAANNWSRDGRPLCMNTHICNRTQTDRKFEWQQP
jgi:hypothetical protein